MNLKICDWGGGGVAQTKKPLLPADTGPEKSNTKPQDIYFCLIEGTDIHVKLYSLVISLIYKMFVF